MNTASKIVNHTLVRPICGFARALPPTAISAQPGCQGGRQRLAREAGFALADP